MSDYGYQHAYDILYEFQHKHHRNLRGKAPFLNQVQLVYWLFFHLKADFKPFLSQLAELKARSTNIHPKLLEIRHQVLDHLNEDGQHKVWIHLQHKRKEIQSTIIELLTQSGVDSATIDPKYLCDDRKRVFLSSNVPSNFPLHILTLIIHYDWPCLLPADIEERLSDTPRCAIFVRRSQQTGNQELEADESDLSEPEMECTPAKESPTATQMTTSPIETKSGINEISIIPDSNEENPMENNESEHSQQQTTDHMSQDTVPCLVISEHVNKLLSFEASQSEPLQVVVLDRRYRTNNSTSAHLLFIVLAAF